jgi:hypothetical protein
MIKLELDEQQAWFLTQLFDECNTGIFEKELFRTFDDASNKYTYDYDFKAAILEIGTILDKARGI